MINYNPEDLVLWNEFAKAKRAKVVSWPASMKYSIESTFTREEKIEAIDTYNQKSGILTYAIKLVDKWNQERGSLPKDNDGWVRTNSMKAWLHKNDPEKLVDDWYHYGLFTIYHEIFGIEQDTKKPGVFATDEVVDKLFHLFCVEQVIAEECIYLAKDPKAVKFVKVQSFTRRFNIFGTQMLCDFQHNLDSTEIENTDEKLLDTLIAKFEAFEKVYNTFDDDFQKIAKDANWREVL